MLSHSNICSDVPYFFRSDAAATIFLPFVLVWLLFKGGVYFIGELADSNNGEKIST